jgi:hypothetical protein
VAHDAVEFRPRLEPILFTAEPDFCILESRLCWLEPRHFPLAVHHG